MTTYKVCVLDEKPANLTPYAALAYARKVLGPFYHPDTAKEVASEYQEIGFKTYIVREA